MQVKRLAYLSRVICMLLPLALICMDAIGQRPTPGKVYVVLWFDTEGLHPCRRAMTRPNGWRRSSPSRVFRRHSKVVGEKARTARADVTAPTFIAALQKHAIGYHANTHSQHPTPAEYESAVELGDWRGRIHAA